MNQIQQITTRSIATSKINAAPLTLTRAIQTDGFSEFTYKNMLAP